VIKLKIRVADEIFEYIELNDPTGNGIRLHLLFNESIEKPGAMLPVTFICMKAGLKPAELLRP